MTGRLCEVPPGARPGTDGTLGGPVHPADDWPEPGLGVGQDTGRLALSRAQGLVLPRDTPASPYRRKTGSRLGLGDVPLVGEPG